VEKVIAEFSGGADSCAALLKALHLWPKAEFYPIFVDYGQAYMAREFRSARLLLGHQPFQTVRVKELRTVSVGGLFQNHSEVYVPMRNLIIGAIAANYAEEVGATTIINGSKSIEKDVTDPHSFADSTLAFYTKLTEAIAAGRDNPPAPIRVCSVLAEGRLTKMTKLEVYDYLEEQNIPANVTYSCWFPPKNTLRCNQCSNCKELQSYYDSK
jgi:7-cyano-7-deazaguanine synthase in queuosine biosynthesis